MSTNATAYERLLDDLRNDGKVVKENSVWQASAQCPAHDDNNPSLSVTGIAGQVLVHCHAGCKTSAVMAALGRGMGDLFDDRKGTSYRYSDGRVVSRKADKAFYQSGNTKGEALFHVEKIGDAHTVYVVEGEKDVLAIEAAGGVAVCSAMGAGKAHLADWSPLAGKDVVVIADCDDSGSKHATQVADIVAVVAASVTVAEALVGKDAADHVAAGKTLDEFVAAPWWPSGESTQSLEPVDGAALLDGVMDWYARFICCDVLDLEILALFTVHTHLAIECYTSPRLLLDSAMPGSGKTTVCEHLSRLACNGILFASLSSTAMLVRILEAGIATLIIDEVDRTLSPDKQGVGDLIAVLNSGYKRGATRPVLVQEKGNNWTPVKMSTFAPVVLAGNSPRLPDDTRTRCIRILLSPDIDGTIEDSDWEYIESDARKLHDEIATWADQVRDRISTTELSLPPECRGRSREKWRPLVRIATVAGAHWPERVTDLIARDLAEEEADRTDGLRNLPPAVVIMRDLFEIWSDKGLFSGKAFVGTKELVSALAVYNPEEWSEGSRYGKRLTESRLGRMITQVSKVHSKRDGRDGPRGYYRVDLVPAWGRLGIGR
jgi:hypothetical protein